MKPGNDGLRPSRRSTYLDHIKKVPLLFLARCDRFLCPWGRWEAICASAQTQCGVRPPRPNAPNLFHTIVTSAPLGIREGAKLASALVVIQGRDRMSIAVLRRRYMASQADTPKQGLSEALESARRRTQKDLANFDRAIEFRDRLRSDAEPIPATGGRKKASSQR